MLSDLGELPSIQLTDTDYLRFELDDLTPFGREVAVKELRETPDVKEKAIEELRKLLQRKINNLCIKMPIRFTFLSFICYRGYRFISSR